MAAREELITGGRQLDDLLKTLPKKLERNVMRAALRAGGVVLREEARRQAPVDDGVLRKSIRISTRSQRGSLYASVKAGSKKAFYAHMVEFGTRPHKIKAKPQSALDVNGNPRRDVDHPGSQPHAFMRPAADLAFQEAIKAFDRKLRERMTTAGLNVPAPAPDDPEP